MKNIFKKIIMSVLVLTCFNAVAVRKYTPGEAMRRATTGDFDASEKDQILADIPEGWKREHKKIVNEIRTGQRSRQAIAERRKKQVERKKKKGMQEDIDLSQREPLFTEDEEGTKESTDKKDREETLEFKEESTRQDLGDKEDVDEKDYNWREELSEEQRNELSQKEQLEQIKKMEEEQEKQKENQKEAANDLCEAMTEKVVDFIGKQYQLKYSYNPSPNYKELYSAKGFTLNPEHYSTDKEKELVKVFNTFMEEFIRVEGSFDIDNYLSTLFEKTETLSQAFGKNALNTKACASRLVGALIDWNKNRLKILNDKMSQIFASQLDQWKDSLKK